MPETQPTPDPAAEIDTIERDILYLLTDRLDNQPLWSVDDLGRAIEDQTDAVDAVAGLLCAGLIHKTSDGFVFATRAAVRMVQMVGMIT